MSRLRNGFHRHAANKIKRVYKGYRARKHVATIREEENEKRKMMFFDIQASVIQKW